MSDFKNTRFNNLGFTTTSNLTPTDWARNNADILHDSHLTNLASKHNRVETDHEDRITRARIQEEQERTRRSLVSRVHNINNYMRRLENEIELARNELGKQTKNRERIYKALDATEVPLATVQDNLNTRNRRIDTDQVVDNVEVQMCAEKDHIVNKQALLSGILAKAKDLEAELNRRIADLQADWSDKSIANRADTYAGNLHNQHTGISGDNDATATEQAKNVAKWEHHCQENITASGTTRTESAKHRDYSAQLIQSQALLSRKHNDIVNRAVHQRLYETINQKRALEAKLGLVEAEFAKAEGNASRINCSLKDIIPPYQVNLTRRNHRNNERPGNTECLNDSVENQILVERANLNASQSMMVDRLEQTQQLISSLQARKDHLNKELRTKTLSIEIDQNEVVPRRASFPSESAIMGY